MYNKDFECPVCGAPAEYVDVDDPGIWVFCPICEDTFDIEV